jgi:hypothetical protein
VYKLKLYRPFEVPVDDGRVHIPELRELWSSVQTEYPGLQDAVGCYIFGVRTAIARPWYVGKTERASFRKEAFQPQKLLLYQDVLRNTRRGTPVLYLIARVTPAGKLRRAAKGEQGVPSIRRLEELLIGTCLSKNPKLLNQKATKHLRLTHVPGYVNERRCARACAERRRDAGSCQRHRSKGSH